MKVKFLAIAAGAILAVGSAVAIAQSGDRDGGAGYGGGQARGDHHHGRGHHGWRRHHGRRGNRDGWRNRGPVTKADFDSRARARFARIDSNGDNVLDAAEIKTSFSDRGMRRGRGIERRFQRMLRRVDENRDGKVTKAEFDSHLKERFARVDLNNDGKITDDDLPPFMRGMNFLGEQSQGRRRHRGHRMLSRLRGADANQDASVSFDEFARRPMLRFMQMDRNKDGTVSDDDLKQLRSEMLDYRVARFIHRFGPDADKAQRVTREQFMSAAEKRFSRRDANNDGMINRQDRRFGRGDRDGPRGPRGGNRGPGRGGTDL